MKDMADEQLKKQVEALLFSAGRMLSAKDMADLIGISKGEDKINKAALKLKSDYELNDSPIMVVEESEGWKMTIREKYLTLVRKINPYTELSKTVMETLAVIAWKNPVLQSTVINIRTNKAYDHIAELEDLGFIIKEKYGRSFMIKLTQKFYEYFDLKDKKDIVKIFGHIKDSDLEMQKRVEDYSEPEMSEEEKQVIEEISKLEEEEQGDSVLEEMGKVGPKD